MVQWFIRYGQGATATVERFDSKRAAVAEARAIRAYAQSIGLRGRAARVLVGWSVDPV